jgi:hypothetical protein
MDHPKSDRRDERGLDADPVAARKVDLKAKAGIERRGVTACQMIG